MKKVANLAAAVGAVVAVALVAGFPTSPECAGGDIEWGTFIGGSAHDGVMRMAAGPEGSVCLAGFTRSADFPMNPGDQSGDQFVAKLDSSSHLLWSLLFHVMNGEINGIAVDPAGNAYITGETSSTTLATPGAFQTTHAGGSYDAFLAAIGPDGALLWATYLGGEKADEATGVAVDASGNVIVTGWTLSPKFPSASAPGYLVPKGGSDAFVAKFTSTGQLVWTKLIGGKDSDSAAGVCTVAGDGIVVGGTTNSKDFPAIGGGVFYPWGVDAFAVKLDSAGTMSWTSFVKNSFDESVAGVSADPEGNVYLAGSTSISGSLSSNWGAGPSSSREIFLAKIAPDGRRLWLGRIGGSSTDTIYGIAADPDGAFICGSTKSTDFPLVNPFKSTRGGPTSGFVAKVASAGGLEWSSYVGGSEHDCATCVAADPDGAAYVAGYTISRDFPAIDGFDTVMDDEDGFAVKIGDGYRLYVESKPCAVDVTGDAAGRTNFTRLYRQNEKLTLTAPPTAVDNGEVLPFVRWVVDGTDMPEGQTAVHVTMNATRTAIATYPYRTLTVNSYTLADVPIGGDKPGITPYTAACVYGRTITLAAEPTLHRTARRYDLAYWTIDGQNQPAGQATIHVCMTADHSVYPTYREFRTNLTITSTPFSGVTITWGAVGKVTTSSVIDCIFDSTISLTAPRHAFVGSTEYELHYWVLDGVPQTFGEPAITVAMDRDHAIEAHYGNGLPRYNVRATPINSVPISGTHPGVTDYQFICEPGTQVVLRAPVPVTNDGRDYRFVRWIKANTTLSSDPELAFTAQGTYPLTAQTITATYEARPPMITVASSPCSGAAISGSHPGTAEYSIDCDYGEDLALQAALSIQCSGTDYCFSQWILDGIPQCKGQPSLQFTARGAHRAEAIYARARLRFRGPGDRGEHPLPCGGATFTVDVFLSNVDDLLGLGCLLEFRDAAGVDAAFLVSTDGGNPIFNGMKIDFNTARWPAIFPAYVSDPATSGWRRLFAFLDLMAPRHVDVDTWVCTLTYEYGPSACGTYSIAGERSNTFIGDNLPYVEQPGSVTIGMAEDVTHDCVVNIQDLIALRGMLGQRLSAGARGDINRDGVVNLLDLIILRNGMGKTCGE